MNAAARRRGRLGLVAGLLAPLTLTGCGGAVDSAAARHDLVFEVDHLADHVLPESTVLAEPWTASRPVESTRGCSEGRSAWVRTAAFSTTTSAPDAEQRLASYLVDAGWTPRAPADATNATLSAARAGPAGLTLRVVMTPRADGHAYAFTARTGCRPR